MKKKHKMEILFIGKLLAQRSRLRVHVRTRSRVVRTQGLTYIPFKMTITKYFSLKIFIQVDIVISYWGECDCRHCEFRLPRSKLTEYRERPNTLARFAQLRVTRMIGPQSFIPLRTFRVNPVKSSPDSNGLSHTRPVILYSGSGGRVWFNFVVINW